MKLGQMTLKKKSNESDYMQLCICGLTEKEALDKFRNYEDKFPIILHGDWTKKGFSENDILKEERQEEYIRIINSLKKETEILGVTLHPPFRSKTSFEDFLDIVKTIEEKTNIPIFVENRSNKRIHLSKGEEIIEFSKKHKMTIDIPQLYISCGYDEEEMLKVLRQLNLDNIVEVHIANVMVKSNRGYVARKLDDGVLNLKEVLKILGDREYYTFEILGGLPTFESQKKLFNTML